ncbi:hypothetical protein GF359_06465 [candidate division WOR-3 bacterium]|uniref:Dipeptidylpeptidase IV N-terminal domain-containing protein n=1 Tax=candidate division WOR-3 bacterium TaxID=2052148 RepID=A0A9D5QD83_UNCW3|nr:hypothetical protein [candidate division WOR-3 bacterium]MBD3364842.1 hypothetical protein [candidate division WOR-3 bacterium]
MKTRLTFLGISVIILGGFLLSCTPPIEGELTMLVEYDTREDITSPHWSSEGSMIYFIHMGPDDVSQIWSVDVATCSLTLIRDEYFYEMDVSRTDDLCSPAHRDYNDSIRVYDLETWDQVYTVFQENIYDYPKFSVESSHIVYYNECGEGWDSTLLHKVDLESQTNEVILDAGPGYYSVTPGPGDSLFVLGDTIYNINTAERIPLELGFPTSVNYDWNPLNSWELIVCDGVGDKCITLLNLETKERQRVKVTLDGLQVASLENPVFSPDGKRIAFVAVRGADSFYRYQLWILDLM